MLGPGWRRQFNHHPRERQTDCCRVQKVWTVEQSRRGGVARINSIWLGPSTIFSTQVVVAISFNRWLYYAVVSQYALTSSESTEMVCTRYILYWRIFENPSIPLFFRLLKWQNQTLFGLLTGQTHSSIPVKIIEPRCITNLLAFLVGIQCKYMYMSIFD